MTKERLTYIDTLKGIAILGVVLAHFCVAFSSPIPGVNTIAAVGSRCPQLFFIISAYLTWASLSKSDTIDSKSFLIKRFVKIAPLFYIALLFTAIFPEIQKFEIANVATHITFANGLFPEYINSMMKVEWYIADLALFYIVTPLLYRYIRNFKTAIMAFSIASVLNIVFTLTTNHLFAEQIANNAAYETYFHTFCFINQLPVLLIGVVLYYINMYLKEQPQLKNRMLLNGTVVIVLFLGVFVALHLNKRVVTSSYVAALLFGLLFMYLSSAKRFNGGGIYYRC